MIVILVNAIGIVLIALVIWWFLIAKPKATAATSDTIDIIVQDGIYSPALIKATPGKLNLRFIRKDTTPCSEVVIFDALGISHTLPINKPYIIILDIKKPGEYQFTCQMGMYQGKLIVEREASLFIK